jgi:hypothetical protein
MRATCRADTRAACRYEDDSDAPPWSRFRASSNSRSRCTCSRSPFRIIGPATFVLGPALFFLGTFLGCGNEFAPEVTPAQPGVGVPLETPVPEFLTPDSPWQTWADREGDTPPDRVGKATGKKGILNKKLMRIR